MTREEKINSLEQIREGLPFRFALDPDKYRVLYGKPGLDYYVTKDGEVVSIAEAKIFKEYFNESFIYINCSVKFPDLL